MSDERSLKDRFPNNSEVSRTKKRGEKEITPVAQGRIAPEKQNFTAKLLENLIATSFTDMWEHILVDTVIPGIKHAIDDFITGSKNMCLWGDSRGERYRHGDSRDRSRVWTSYDSMSRSSDYWDKRGRRDEPPRELPRAKQVSRNLVEEVLFDYEEQAKEILGDLIARCHEYEGSVTVNDYYVMAGIDTDYTKRKYGWYERDLDNVEILRIREGWLMKMPRPVVLD